MHTHVHSAYTDTHLRKSASEGVGRRGVALKVLRWCQTALHPVVQSPGSRSSGLRPISVLRFLMSEGLTRAESESLWVGLPCPWGISQHR